MFLHNSILQRKALDNVEGAELYKSRPLQKAKKLDRQKRQLHSDERKKGAARATLRVYDDDWEPRSTVHSASHDRRRSSREEGNMIFYSGKFSPHSLFLPSIVSRNIEIIGNCRLKCELWSVITNQPRGAYPLDRQTDSQPQLSVHRPRVRATRLSINVGKKVGAIR